MKLALFSKKFQVLTLTEADLRTWVSKDLATLGVWNYQYAAAAVCSCGWFGAAVHGEEAEVLAEAHREEHREKGHVDRGG